MKYIIKIYDQSILMAKSAIKKCIKICFKQ